MQSAGQAVRASLIGYLTRDQDLAVLVVLHADVDQHVAGFEHRLAAKVCTRAHTGRQRLQEAVKHDPRYEALAGNGKNGFGFVNDGMGDVDFRLRCYLDHFAQGQHGAVAAFAPRREVLLHVRGQRPWGDAAYVVSPGLSGVMHVIVLRGSPL